MKKNDSNNIDAIEEMIGFLKNYKNELLMKNFEEYQKLTKLRKSLREDIDKNKMPVREAFDMADKYLYTKITNAYDFFCYMTNVQIFCMSLHDEIKKIRPRTDSIKAVLKRIKEARKKYFDLKEELEKVSDEQIDLKGNLIPIKDNYDKYDKLMDKVHKLTLQVKEAHIALCTTIENGYLEVMSDNEWS